jgi:hypothetical protein
MDGLEMGLEKSGGQATAVFCAFLSTNHRFCRLPPALPGRFI